MAKWIKNDTVGDKTWVGQLVLTGAYYEIQSTEELAWINDSILLTDIGSGDAIVAKDNSGNEDITDVNLAINYLKDLKTELEIDYEGRQIERVAYGKKGWTYLAYPIEFETSKLGSEFCEDWKGNDRNDCDIRFYNSSGTELVAGTQAELDSNCTETRIIFNPDYDYEVISGKIEQHATPAVTDDVRLWVVGGVLDDDYPWEYPASSGVFHVKEFAGGINLKYMGKEQEIETDGRASKFMCKTKTGVPYNANQFLFIIKHPVGYNHEIMIILEYFRA